MESEFFTIKLLTPTEQSRLKHKLRYVIIDDSNHGQINMETFDTHPRQWR